jgi:hypothetical protein
VQAKRGAPAVETKVASMPRGLRQREEPASRNLNPRPFQDDFGETKD